HLGSLPNSTMNLSPLRKLRRTGSSRFGSDQAFPDRHRTSVSLLSAPLSICGKRLSTANAGAIHPSLRRSSHASRFRCRKASAPVLSSLRQLARKRRIVWERREFMLWDAIDIRSAFAHRKPPAATHLCIGILIMEG